MKTRIFTPDEIAPAAEILRSGGLLGIPTETVYGLGANGLDPEAVTHIFEAKGRPQDNPLILHIPTADWLARYCDDIPPVAYVLAKAFWPGPMTIILKRKAIVPDVVTAGLDSVGMRCPAHAVCRAIIQAANVPVAAPSGNASGRPSPTTAAHMLEDMDGKIDAIVDGGPCAVGVESTIIDVTVTPPRLLRPGGITLEQLQAVLGAVAVDPAVTRLMEAGEQPRAPGMKYRHYAPKAPVTVVKGDSKMTAGYLEKHAEPGDGVICFDEYAALYPDCVTALLGPAHNKEEQARRVFDALRAFDKTAVTTIWAQCPDDHDIGLAIANRLNKAAGFHVIDLNTMKIIGITGPTGAGKTTALRVLADMGALLIDADAVYHELLLTSAPLRETLCTHFGDVLDGAGMIDRKALGEKVFADEQALLTLNEITHRFVGEELDRRLSDGRAHGIPSAAIDAIALFESGFGAKCDSTVAILAPPAVRIRRIMAREGISEEYAQKRVAAQRDDAFFRANCTHVLENGAGDTPETFGARAKALFEQILND